MENVRSFKINIGRAAVEDLQKRLSISKFPVGIEGGSWERGVPLEDIKRIAKYWQENFDWHSFERKLNELSHFETTITLEGFDSFQVHFIHQRSSDPDAIPLLFVHGCTLRFFLLPVYPDEL